MSQQKEFAKGIFAGIFCFAFWGLAPIFWKLFAHVSALELLFHRIVWGFLIIFLILLVTGNIPEFFRLFKSKRKVGLLLLTSALISTNWFIFTYAMIENHIVEASLGYFINPLMNVFIGSIFLGEKLSKRKWLALFFAFLGVLNMFYGKVDGIEISLLLAVTFALYGLIRKQLDIRSEFGLTFELFVAAIPATVLLIMGGSDQYQFFSASTPGQFLFISCGLVTIIPLFFFVYSAKRLQYSQVGILQYIAPFLQLIVGTLIYHEPFSKSHSISFILIWSAIIIFMSKEIKSIFSSKQVRPNV